ncbi:unnamed protein product [marine sediment metagenome]|uniref:Uncharacterized protein n=1 Tax=marine sediment metagenome TaxID=412755 RepID=X1BIX8_9ZZZZ
MYAYELTFSELKTIQILVYIAELTNLFDLNIKPLFFLNSIIRKSIGHIYIQMGTN